MMTNENSEHIEQQQPAQPSLLDEYDNKAQAAASAFKKAVSAATERQAKYGVDAREEIDLAKANLDEAAASIQAEYADRLAKELTKAKQAAMSSGSISKAERQAAEPFLSDVRLSLAVHGAESTVQLMQTMADTLSPKQRAYVFKTIAGDLATAGGDIRALSDLYADPDAQASYSRIQQLEAMKLEDAALSISTLRRTHSAYLDKSDVKYQH